MALVKCPECGREKVSDQAEICPDCGFPIKNHFDGLKKKKEQQQKKNQERVRVLFEEYKDKSKEELENIIKDKGVKSIEGFTASKMLQNFDKIQRDKKEEKKAAEPKPAPEQKPKPEPKQGPTGEGPEYAYLKLANKSKEELEAIIKRCPEDSPGAINARNILKAREEKEKENQAQSNQASNKSTDKSASKPQSSREFYTAKDYSSTELPKYGARNYSSKSASEWASDHQGILAWLGVIAIAIIFIILINVGSKNSGPTYEDNMRNGLYKREQGKELTKDEYEAVKDADEIYKKEIEKEQEKTYSDWKWNDND